MAIIHCHLGLEIRGHRPDAETVAVSRNEWLICMNKREVYDLATVIVNNGKATALPMIADQTARRSPFRGARRYP